MIANKLKRLWAEGRPTINGWLSIGNSFTAEIMAAQGYDSLTIDVQHGALDYSAALPMLQAMRASGTVLMARVPWLEPGIIMKVLDAGAYCGEGGFFAQMAAMHALGPYVLETADVESSLVYSNNQPSSSIRAPTAPQVCWALEQHMDEPLPTVGTHEPVQEAVARLKDADALLVQEDGKPVGVVTRQDLLAFIANR